MSSHDTRSSTVDSQEILKFSALSREWWNPYGPMKALHDINSQRISFIKNQLMNANATIKEETSVSKPLKGLRILDVGCGAGILSESLARLGAEVLGIDASVSNIAIAKSHASLDPLFNIQQFSTKPAQQKQQQKLDDKENNGDIAQENKCDQFSKDNNGTLKYIHTSIETMLNQENNGFDAICALEVIEHIPDPGQFIDHCFQLLKPGAILFLSTLDRSWYSYLMAIILAERVFGLLDRGTHNWDRFVKPTELFQLLKDRKFRNIDFATLCYNPISGQCTLHLGQPRAFIVNYIVSAQKSFVLS